MEDIFTIDPNRIKNKKNIKNAFKHQVWNDLIGEMVRMKICAVWSFCSGPVLDLLKFHEKCRSEMLTIIEI